MEYREIVFLQGDQAKEALNILEKDGENEAFLYLLQWDHGEAPITEGNQPFGSEDKLYYRQDYIMSYNPRISYIGLIQVQ